MTHTVNSNFQSFEVAKPDYQAVYAAIARRVAAADAYFVSANYEEARREIEKAMIVIEQVDNPFVLISPTS